MPNNNIRGFAKMKTRVGLALAVVMALALGRVRVRHAERMRSFVGAVRPAACGRRASRGRLCRHVPVAF